MYIDRRGLYRHTIEILRELVSHDTTSRKDPKTRSTQASNTNLPLLDYVEELIRDPRVKTERIAYPGDVHSRSNLIIRVGPDKPGGILLSGHTDVVPVDNQPTWIGDPWTMRSSEGWHYGRGTADMKGFIACCLAMVPKWANAKLEKPIYIILSYGEEVGCIGIGSALELLKKRGITPELSIVGEPTLFEVVEAHKGRTAVQLMASATGGEVADINGPVTSAYDAHTLAYLDMIYNRSGINTALGNAFLGPASFGVTSINVGGSGGGGNVIPAKHNPDIEIHAAPDTTEERIFQFLNPYLAEAVQQYGHLKRATIGSDKSPGPFGLDLEIKKIDEQEGRFVVRIVANATGGHAAEINGPITSAYDAHTIAYGEMIKNRHIINAQLGDSSSGPAKFGVTFPDAAGKRIIISEYFPTTDIRTRQGMTEETIFQTLQSNLVNGAQTYDRVKRATITPNQEPGQFSFKLDIELVNPGFWCTNQACIHQAMAFARTDTRTTANYVTEAARFQEQGLNNVVVCGPGSILVAHQPNERIHGGQIVKGLNMLQRVGMHCMNLAA